MADIGRPLLWQAADDCWATWQSADLILYAVLAAMPATAITEKLHVAVYPTHLQDAHTTGAYRSALFPRPYRVSARIQPADLCAGRRDVWRYSR